MKLNKYLFSIKWNVSLPGVSPWPGWGVFLVEFS